MWGEGWVCVDGDWEVEVGGGTDCCMGDKQPLTRRKIGSSNTHIHHLILFTVYRLYALQ